MRVNEVYEGDCLDVMRQFPDNCIDTIITDPPYGLQFMGRDWDYGLPGEVYWREALRIAKPGATLMAFGGTRTYHRLTCAIEDAGWEIRDCADYFNDGNQQETAFMASLNDEQLAAYLELYKPNKTMAWIYGSGFPKSLDIGKAIDRSAIVDCRYCNGSGKGRPSYMVFCPEHGEIMGDNHLCPACDGEAEEVELEREPCKYCGGSGKVKGAEREIVGKGINFDAKEKYNRENMLYQPVGSNGPIITAPSTPLAQQWDGWGSGGLKPAYEPIVVAMKPVEQNFAHNAEKWGVSGLWIEGGRIGVEIIENGRGDRGIRDTGIYGAYNGEDKKRYINGRWPANVIHDGSDEVEAEFAKAGVRTSGAKNIHRQAGIWSKDIINLPVRNDNGGDSGSASRFFYTAKASPSERRPYNNHPTVKPLSLLRYLAKLTRTPTGGIVLDPFAGSGTTALACIAEGRDFILIEKEPEYAELCRRRIAEYTGQEIEAKEIEMAENESVKQLALW